MPERGAASGKLTSPRPRESNHLAIRARLHVKGIVAAHHKTSEQSDLFKTAFGCGSASDALAGALVFSNARLVALPVPSCFGTFAWITSPFALRRLARDFVILNVKSPEIIPMPVNMGNALTPQDKTVLSEGGDSRIFLEDLDLARKNSDQTAVWAAQIAQWLFGEDKNWSDQFINRLPIVADEVSISSPTLQRRCAREFALAKQAQRPIRHFGMGKAFQLKHCSAALSGANHHLRVVNMNRIISSRILSKELYLQIGSKPTVGHGRVRCRLAANDSIAHEHQNPIHPHS